MKKTTEADKMQQTCFGEKVLKEGEEKKEKKNTGGEDGAS